MFPISPLSSERGSLNEKQDLEINNNKFKLNSIGSYFSIKLKGNQKMDIIIEEDFNKENL